MHEFDLIRTYFAPLAKQFPGALALTDDAALINVPAGMQLVVTKDAISAGVHFIGDEDASLIARKLLRVNLSDLAAKGATPLAYLLALALPKETDEAFIARFAQGLATDQAEFNIHLAGGDTLATHGPLTCSLTALGLVPTGTMLKRSGARAGDLLCISGTIGDSALGLKYFQDHTGSLFNKEEGEYFASRYALPIPRLALGQGLRGIASAAMDISDGLVQDAGHLCTTSGCGAEIFAAQIPLSPAAMNKPQWLETILTGGDDYELLFTLGEEKLAVAQSLGTQVTVIGRMTKENGVHVLDQSGTEIILNKCGYQHF